MNILPGDIVFCHNRSVLGWAIRWFERRRGEEKSYANHTAGIVENGYVLEALWTVKKTKWSDWKRKHKNFKVWRYRHFNQGDRLVVAREAEKYFGRKYGWWKILFAHAPDCLLSKILGKDVYFFRKPLFIKKYPICSWIWSWAYYKRGIQFGTAPAYADPDVQSDYVEETPDDWELIIHQKSL